MLQNPSADLLQKTCNALKTRCSLAAIPQPGDSQLLVLSDKPISQLLIEEDDWRAEVMDSSTTRLLEFKNLQDRFLMAQLVERYFLIKIGLLTKLWSLDSHRILYEPEPFKTVEDIAAYRRFEISALAIDEVGIGIAVDVGTAFFTISSLDYFFATDVPDFEQRRRQKLFNFLSERQKGKKATLWYQSGRGNHKCYFAEFLPGMTCEMVKDLRLKGRTYKSLLEYYRIKSPGFPVSAKDPVAKVSFSNIAQPQPVAANQLRLRVTNESLPKTLKQVDKLPPWLRCQLIEKFWEKPSFSLELNELQVESHFWQPPKDKVKHLKFPNLVFAQGESLSAPDNRDLKAQKDHYRRRKSLLRRVGCLKVPPTIPRTIYVRVPTRIGEAAAIQLGDDLATYLSKCTNKPLKPNVDLYDDFEQVVSELNQESQPGLVIFVFENDDPATYYTVNYELKKWRVKHILADTLQEQFVRLQAAQSSFYSNNKQGEWDWQSFIETNALEVLQQLDCVFWTFAGNLNYDAHVAVDVGWDRRHFALSLLICQWQPDQLFQLETKVPPKVDYKHETINKEILRDQMVALFKQRQRPSSLRKVLALRDGRECGQELKAIEEAQEQLIQSGCFDNDVQIDVVDVHKQSAKGIRFWWRTESNKIEQTSEGVAVFLDSETVVLTTTGAPTLHQGTAEPVILVARSEGVDMLAVAEDFYAKTHLNWSNPSVAQRLPIELKRTDDELVTRAAQEIRRVS